MAERAIKKQLRLQCILNSSLERIDLIRDVKIRGNAFPTFYKHVKLGKSKWETMRRGIGKPEHAVRVGNRTPVIRATENLTFLIEFK